MASNLLHGVSVMAVHVGLVLLVLGSKGAAAQTSISWSGCGSTYPVRCACNLGFVHSRLQQQSTNARQSQQACADDLPPLNNMRIIHPASPALPHGDAIPLPSW
jgi:hypothetical protein